MAHTFRYATDEAREVLRERARDYTDRSISDDEKKDRVAAATLLLDDAAELLRGYGYEAAVLVHDVGTKSTAHAFRRRQGGYLVIPIRNDGALRPFVQHEGDRLRSRVQTEDIIWDPSLRLFVGPWTIDETGKRVRRQPLATLVERILDEVLS